MSNGAKQAGLAVKWGLERDVAAARTFQKNFVDAVCENASVEQFIHFPPAQYHVDILHLSPPCQSFSAMQTRRGEHAEENEVVILSVNELVKMIQPRIITMEEVPGLLFDRSIDFFALVIGTLTEHGYSVRWKVANFLDYGVPQARQRLILIAAASVKPTKSTPKLKKPPAPFRTNKCPSPQTQQPFTTIRPPNAPSNSQHHLLHDRQHPSIHHTPRSPRALPPPAPPVRRRPSASLPD